jgi:hypothetical protein
VIPNFFVVGAPKAGTSSLYQYLSQHPSVFVPEIKEPHHFSYPEVADTYYKAAFIDGRSEYKQLYSRAKETQWAGDFSPSYLHSTEAAGRIFAFNPNARIIILLRNPTDRAISHYLMDVRLGIQKKPMLSSIGGSEANRLYRKEYLEVGLYSQQVQRYLDLFPAEQVLLMNYDELASNASCFVVRVLDFLGLEATQEIDTDEKFNTFRLPRSALLGSLYNSSLKRKLRKIVPSAWKTYVRDLIFSGNRPAMQKERRELVTIFEADVCALELLAGWDLADWKRAG